MNHRSSLATLLVSSGLLAFTMAQGATPTSSVEQGGNAHPERSASAGSPRAVPPTAVTAAQSSAKLTHSAQGALTAGAATPSAASKAASAPTTVLAAAAPAENPDALGESIDDAQLANARGGSDTHTDTNNTTGAVSGNVASQLTTGSNTISSSAFSNSSGIPIVIQNSGNNVLIQNSTILNLQLTNSGK